MYLSAVSLFFISFFRMSGSFSTSSRGTSLLWPPSNIPKTDSFSVPNLGSRNVPIQSLRVTHKKECFHNNMLNQANLIQRKTLWIDYGPVSWKSWNPKMISQQKDKLVDMAISFKLLHACMYNVRNFNLMEKFYYGKQICEYIKR